MSRPPYPYQLRPPLNASWPKDAVQHTLIISGPSQGTSERRVCFTAQQRGRNRVFVWVGSGPGPHGDCFGTVSDRKALRAWATALLAELDRTKRSARKRKAARRG